MANSSDADKEGLVEDRNRNDLVDNADNGDITRNRSAFASVEETHFNPSEISDEVFRNFEWLDPAPSAQDLLSIRKALIKHKK